MFLLGLVFSSSAQDKNQRHKNEKVQLGAIEIEGTRLPPDSIRRILDLKTGETVDDNALLAACDRVSHTGLVADIDYSFRPIPNNAAVAVIFKIWDEKKLLPATVIPNANESLVWACLQGADAIFTRQLPNTKDALRFYVVNIDKCITDTSNQQLHAVARVLCDESKTPAQIQFRIEPGAVTNHDVEEANTAPR